MSRIASRIWPFLLLSLMAGALLHWGVPAGTARAQGNADPAVLELSASTMGADNVVIATDVMNVTVDHFGEGRVWLYLWHDDSGLGASGCLDHAVDENLRDDGLLDGDGSITFTMDVTVPPFVGGAGNRFCLLRRDGVYTVSDAFEVDVRPSVYRMQLEISDIALQSSPTGLLDSSNDSLSADFRVDGGRGLSEWTLPQRRGGHVGVGGIPGANALVSVDGQWSACPEEGDLVVGCHWEDLVHLEDRADTLMLPGREAVLRLRLPQDTWDNRAAERFVVFWGPVDLWLLGTQHGDDDPGHAAGEVEPRSFVVHSEHLKSIASEINSRVVQLTPGDYVDLPISNSSSSNSSGHTFVSLVSCNDDYLDALGTSSEVRNQKTALQDCTRLQGPSFGSYGKNLPDDADSGLILGWHYLRQAWLQHHDVLNGRGMRCEVTPTVYSNWSSDEGRWLDSWTLELDCYNDVEQMGTARAITKPFAANEEPDFARCERVLARTYAWGDMAFSHDGEGDQDRMGETTGTDGNLVSAVSGIDMRPTVTVKCGWGPERVNHEVGGQVERPLFPGFYTRYNAARSFYSFVLEWEEKGSPSDDAYGCGSMLFPHNDGVARPSKADRWLLGELPPARCEVVPDQDSISVGLFAPRPPEPPESAIPSFANLVPSTKRQLTLAHQRQWGRYDDHAAHFAVYVSGMPAGHDYEVDPDADAGDWRRVALGSWHYGEDLSAVDVGDVPRALLGVAHPVGEAVGGLDAVPSMSEMYDGFMLEVTRDYVDAEGYVRLYVVPCRPLYSTGGGADDACEHLPPRVGPVRSASFAAASSEAGPFYVEERGGVAPEFRLHYSFKFTIDFQGRVWSRTDERSISPPREVEPDGSSCGVSSRVDDVVGGYWPEVTVAGGACDSDTLDTVPVSIWNVNADFSDNLVVYVTGGRTDGMDLVQLKEVGEVGAAEPLGRLGLRERLLAFRGVGAETLYINPDLADKEGNVWVVGYSCGSPGGTPSVVRPHGASGYCPQAQKYRELPLYDVAVPPSFVVRVRFTPESGLGHSNFDPVCQGDDCAPLVPDMRKALPDAPDGACGASSYPAGGRELIYWPDRVVSGGACDAVGLDEVEVVFHNASGLSDQHMVVYATGGRGAGLDRVQVQRGGAPAGRVGLRRVEFTLSGGETGRVLVDQDLASGDGQVWLLAYRCSGPFSVCPAAMNGDDLTTYSVGRRPLFEVLVQYDAGRLGTPDFSICKGDDCLVSYGLERLAEPAGRDCTVSASYSQDSIYWPNRVFAGGACDRHDLDNVAVSFGVPASASSGERLVVYVTGGRSPGLEDLSVLRAEAGGAVGGSPVQRTVSSLVRYPQSVVNTGPNFGNARYTGSLVQAHGTQNMKWAYDDHRELYDTLEAKAWVQDGLSDVEERVLDYLLYLAAREPDTARSAKRVSVMPFLDTVDVTDYLTVRALHGASHREMIDPILGHLELDDGGGIEDDERMLVIGASTRHGVPGAVGLLDAGYLSPLDTGLAASAHGADVPVTVAWTGAARRADMVDHTVSSVEAVANYMGRSFPVGHVALLMDAESVSPGAAGTNYGYAIATRPDLAPDFLKSTIVHEVAHYYWNGSDAWIDEGLASAFEAILGPSFGIPDKVTRNERGGCDLLNLQQLVEANSGTGQPAFHCNYYLGQGLFLDLWEDLGATEFRAGLIRLYQAGESCERSGEVGSCRSIADVRAAFPDGQSIISRHWSGGLTTPVAADSKSLGRMGLRERMLTIAVDGFAAVDVSPDLAGSSGDVWLLAYRCDAAHGGVGCPLLRTPAYNGFDLPVGPAFAVRVRFTQEAGLKAADLQEVCRGQHCDIKHPWLRAAEPPAEGCEVEMGAYWPDRVVGGGGCLFHGADYGSVDFRNAGPDLENFVVYATGGYAPEFSAVQVYGVFGGSSESPTGDSAATLGRRGLIERRLGLSPGSFERVWVRSDMADGSGNVWLLVYRCSAEHGDPGCPLVDGNAVRPLYSVDVRPTFVVKMSFLNKADAEQSALSVECPTVDRCVLTAVFRDPAGKALSGVAEFRADNGELGQVGSMATSSRRQHMVVGGRDYEFVETLHLPASGGMVNVTVELLGDGLILERRVGRAADLERLEVRLMRCFDDVVSCHEEPLEEVFNGLARGDRFLFEVVGYDAAGDVGLVAGRHSQSACVAGISGGWPSVWIDGVGLRAHDYGSGQQEDRGYAGCGFRVADDADYGVHGYSVLYGSGSAALRTSGQVEVVREVGELAYLDLRGPVELESGETGTFWAVGYSLSGLPVELQGECLSVSVSGELTGADPCVSEILPQSGVEFDVVANEAVLLDTDSSVGVSYQGFSVRRHVLVVPPEEQRPPVLPVGDSYVTDLSVTQEGNQLWMSWVGHPTAAFASVRVQMWVEVGGVDVFLPGCEGGEVHSTTTHEVFCMLSHGQSGDVYHGAVGYFRWDGSAVPVETIAWTRP